MSHVTMADVRKIWESAAPGWARWEAVISDALSTTTDTLIDMAGVQPGMRVLDLACGAGTQTIRVCQRTGPEGSVLASDISATMLEHVARNAAAAGLGNIETLEAAAEELDGTLGPFDAAICRFGLMLFPAPREALHAVHRVLAPGARFAVLVFTTPAANAFLARPMQILLRHAGKPPPPPGTPGLFALGAEGMLQTMMQDSGFTSVETRRLQEKIRLPDAAAASDMMREAVGALRAVVADLDPDARAAAWADVHESLRQFETDGRFEADLELLIASGAKPD